jgi:hypothetical protein
MSIVTVLRTPIGKEKAEDTVAMATTNTSTGQLRK